MAYKTNEKLPQIYTAFFEFMNDLLVSTSQGVRGYTFDDIDLKNTNPNPKNSIK